MNPRVPRLPWESRRLMIRTFVFDMGNVLLHFSHERMCAQIAEVCSRPAEAVRELLFPRQRAGALWADFECGRIGQREFRRRVEEGVGRQISPRPFRRALHAHNDSSTE